MILADIYKIIPSLRPIHRTWSCSLYKNAALLAAVTMFAPAKPHSITSNGAAKLRCKEHGSAIPVGHYNSENLPKFHYKLKFCETFFFLNQIKLNHSMNHSLKIVESFCNFTQSMAVVCHALCKISEWFDNYENSLTKEILWDLG